MAAPDKKTVIRDLIELGKSKGQLTTKEILDAIEEAQPDLEIDSHRGEQPLYPVIFSIE